MLLYLFIVKLILQNLKNFQRNGNIYKFLLLKVEQSCNNLFSTFIASYIFFFFFFAPREKNEMSFIIDNRYQNVAILQTNHEISRVKIIFPLENRLERISV